MTWTPYEKAMAAKLWREERWTLEAIAAQLGKTRGSVSTVIRRKGLFGKGSAPSPHKSHRVPRLRGWRKFLKEAEMMPLTEAVILGAVHWHNVGIDALTGPSRRKPIVRARWACWIVLRERGYSYPQIARRFGRDHTSVIHGVDQAKALVGNDRNFTKAVEALRRVAEAARSVGTPCGQPDRRAAA